MHRWVRKVLRAVARRDPDYYDMYLDANEACFAELYLERILAHAASVGIRPPARLLDAGCQAGRLLVPFAQHGFDVTGVDTSGFALRRAKRHAQAAGVRATFLRGDLLRVLRKAPAGCYDIVVCAEVVYLSPRYREMLAALTRAVRPGGVVCVSHRPQGYYVVEALRQGDVASALEVLRRREGPFRESRYYNWQTEDDLRQLYREAGLEWLAMYPIDRLAWLSRLNPSAMSQEDRALWRQLEEHWAGPEGAWGRYVLVIASKPA